MKKLIIIVTFLFYCHLSIAQGFIVLTPNVYVTKTYSSNHNFCAVCTPYYNQLPSLFGHTVVYNKAGAAFYTIDRDFNGLEEHNFLAVSNDGRTLLYVISENAKENTDGLRSMSVYRDGKLIKSFTQQAITGCDPLEERCKLLYTVPSEIAEDEKTLFDARHIEEEKYLKSSSVIQIQNLVYLIDPRWMVHIFDMDKDDTIDTKPLDQVFEYIRYTHNDSLTAFEQFKTPYIYTESEFPNLLNGDTTCNALAKDIGMKAESMSAPSSTYRQYKVDIHALIGKDGSIEIKNLSTDLPVSLDTIKRFFTNHKYDLSFLPEKIDKWYFTDFFCWFRDTSDVKAIADKKAEIQKDMFTLKQNLTADSIERVYIPYNLQDCFTTLDKILPNVAKKEMRALKKKSDMINYHFSLGMWMRNNWGLWGGSRLLVYFKDHGTIGSNNSFPNAEEVSSIILYSYYDWLHDDKNAAINWEKQNPLNPSR